MHLTRKQRDQLTTARKKADITQRQLADKLGVSRVYITQLEGGDRAPSADRLKQWAKAVGMRAEVVPALVKLTKRRKA